MSGIWPSVRDYINRELEAHRGAIDIGLPVDQYRERVGAIRALRAVLTAAEDMINPPAQKDEGNDD